MLRKKRCTTNCSSCTDCTINRSTSNYNSSDFKDLNCNNINDQSSGKSSFLEINDFENRKDNIKSELIVTTKCHSPQDSTRNSKESCRTRYGRFGRYRGCHPNDLVSEVTLRTNAIHSTKADLNTLQDRKKHSYVFQKRIKTHPERRQQYISICFLPYCFCLYIWRIFHLFLVDTKKQEKRISSNNVTIRKQQQFTPYSMTYFNFFRRRVYVCHLFTVLVCCMIGLIPFIMSRHLRDTFYVIQNVKDQDENNFTSYNSRKSFTNERKKEWDVEHNNRRHRLVTIFYNVYMPFDKTGWFHAVSVVKEQLKQIGNSDLMLLLVDQNLNDNDKEFVQVQLLYNTIGKAFQPGQLEQWCIESHPLLHCIHVQHYTSADESVTLQTLYDYCNDIDIVKTTSSLSSTPSSSTRDTESRPEFLDRDTVVYLHSKGSFHNNAVNDAWRRSLTAAALHEQCFIPSKYNNSNYPHENKQICNVCGLQFFTMFTMFVPGNMWTSRCSYIRHLIPPLNSIPTIAESEEEESSVNMIITKKSLRQKKRAMMDSYDIELNNDHHNSVNNSWNSPSTTTFYQRMRERAVEEMLLHRIRGYINTTLLRDRRDYYGLDRYSSEHWIGSHPHVMPCDLDPIGKLSELFHKKRSKWRRSSAIYLGRHKQQERKNQLHLQSMKRQSFYWQFMRLFETQRQKQVRKIRQFDDAKSFTVRSPDDYNNNDDLDIIVDSYGFNFSIGPRHKGFIVPTNVAATAALMQSDDIRFQEYYLLPGHLLKWAIMYNTSPANDSWIWNWFPDGGIWKNAVKQYGIHQAVSKVNSHFRFEHHMAHNPYSVPPTNNTKKYTAETISEPANLVNITNTDYVFIYDTTSGENDVLLSSAFWKPSIQYHRTTMDDGGTTTTSATYHSTGTRSRKSRDWIDSTTNLTLNHDSRTDHVVFYHIEFHTWASSNHNNSNDKEGFLMNEFYRIMDFVKDQFSVLSSSYAVAPSSDPTKKHQKLTVFYTIASSPQFHKIMSTIHNAVSETCMGYTNILDCRLLNHFPNAYVGETLQQLHRFCTTMEKGGDDGSMSVIYINNHGPAQSRLNSELRDLRNLLLQMTMAVTDKLCLQQHPHTEQESINKKPKITTTACNVCGLIFYTVWTLFFPGNMFATKCSYVRQLLSPVEYEERMTNHVVGKIVLAKLRTKLTMTLLPSTDRRPDYIGLDQYGIEHWIGSHPSIVPCDLSNESQTLSYWIQSIPLTKVLKSPPARVHNTNTSIVTASNGTNSYILASNITPNYRHNVFHNNPLFHWSVAPHHLDVPDLIHTGFNHTAKSLVWSNDSLRYREYHFLAGHILKWYELYNNKIDEETRSKEQKVVIPSETSWVWSWFPDGTLWKDAIMKHGLRNAFDVITSKFATDGM